MGINSTASASDHVGLTHSQAIKTKSFYDGTNRLQYFAVAPKEAANGDKCLVTQYTYIGATARVDASLEYFGIWNSSWDLVETALP